MKGSGETKLLLILAAIVFIGGGAMYLLNKASEKIDPNKPPPTPAPFSWNDESFGKLTKDAKNVHEGPNPTVTMVEFADFQCPSCRRAFNTVLSKMKKENKPVRFYFRHLPLTEMHEFAMPAAMAAEAAGKQGKFWEMYDALFEGEKTELSTSYIEKCAKKVGLDMAKYKEDLEDPAARERISEDIKMSQEFNIQSTPTFIIKSTDGKYTQVIGAKDLTDALKKNGITL